MHEDIEKKAELRLEPQDAKGRAIEFDFFFKAAMRRVIAGQNGDGAIGDTFDQRVDVALGPERRIHFEIRVEAAERFVRQRDVMRADFAAEFDAAVARFAEKPHAAPGAEVLAMDRRVAEFREERIALDDDFLAGRRPARQPEHRAPVALVHHAFADEMVVLAMVHDDQPKHARILQRAPHHVHDSGCNGRRR